MYTCHTYNAISRIPALATELGCCACVRQLVGMQLPEFACPRLIMRAVCFKTARVGKEGKVLGRGNDGLHQLHLAHLCVDAIEVLHEHGLARGVGADIHVELFPGVRLRGRPLLQHQASRSAAVCGNLQACRYFGIAALP